MTLIKVFMHKNFARNAIQGLIIWEFSPCVVSRFYNHNVCKHIQIMEFLKYVLSILFRHSSFLLIHSEAFVDVLLKLKNKTFFIYRYDLQGNT